MENENKIANEVEEVITTIMEEISEEVAADEATEVTEEVVEEAIEEVVEETTEEIAEETTEKPVEETEEFIEEEASEEMNTELTIKDNNSLYEEIVTTKKVEPYGSATRSVVFGAIGLILPFVAMLFWVLGFRCFAFVSALTALAFGIVSLVTSFKAKKFPCTLSFEMSKAGRTFSILALVFSSLANIYMISIIIKEIIITAIIIILAIVAVLYGGAVAPQWIETLMPMLESYMYY